MGNATPSEFKQSFVLVVKFDNPIILYCQCDGVGGGAVQTSTIIVG